MLFRIEYPQLMYFGTLPSIKDVEALALSTLRVFIRQSPQYSCHSDIGTYSKQGLYLLRYIPGETFETLSSSSSEVVLNKMPGKIISPYKQVPETKADRSSL